MIKWAIISVCGIGIALTWFLTSLILEIHAVHGFSTVREFESLELIDQAKLEELKNKPRYQNYSIAKRVRDVGATNRYFDIFRVVLTLVFIVIMALASALPNPRLAKRTQAMDN